MHDNWQVFDDWFLGYCKRNGIFVDFKTGENHEFYSIAQAAWKAATEEADKEANKYFE